MKKNLKSKIALFIASMTLCMCTMQGAFANPLHDAVKSGDLSQVMVQFGQNHEWSEEFDNNGHTPLALAVHDNKTEVAKFLLQYGDVTKINTSTMYTWGVCPLHYAVLNANTELIELLLNCGADINRKDMDGNTPLHRAVEKANSDERYKAIVSLLISHGADTTIKNRRGITPQSAAQFTQIGLNFWSNIWSNMTGYFSFGSK